ncbi:chondroitin sulfate synthase 2 isoform X2 [Copidosoma floridanum]|uniref:chondroitin sulfate synthase 2 isoform X2 n=1 Tax=Copidosoma floridanum TaxID=29053 RepID=UPI0006C9D21F|nr:chondroitin sulfate synthase 2 isoform X2 [Copidosoma floridanum]
MELLDVGRKIGGLHAEISRTANFTADIDLTWPIGSQPKFKTANRFDVLKWTYFNMTHSFYDDDFGVVEEFSSREKNEVEEIINTTVKTFLKNSEQKLVFTNLENGYWKLDNARGVDYLLDLSFLTNEEREISIRIQACQPVGKVEILPAPYVTENSRINMVIIVDFRRITEAIRFLAHYANVCMDRKDKTSLTIILLYNPGHVSKGSNDIFYTVKQRVLYLTHKYKKDQLKVTWFSIRLPTVTNFVETESSLKIAIADLYINKLTSDNLILLADSRMEIKVEFLNRVRMNTINQWQVFSPIPFVQYNPSIIQYGEKNHVMFDIIHSNGRFDEYNYDFVSFYARDYATVRKSIKNQIPLVQTDKDIASMLKLSQSVPINSIFDMFAVHGKLNTFRATEPALKLFYRDVSCNGTKNNLSQSMCLKRKSLQLGNRGQLARLILNYQEQYH